MFTQMQPKDGDTVLTCPHIDAKLFHWWKGPWAVEGPEGVVMVDWMAACAGCTQLAFGEPSKIAWGKLHTWEGDDPIIKTAD